VESYLARLIPALANEGHELALLFETDTSAALPELTTKDRSWFASEIGIPQLLHRLRRWRPDIIYIHGFSDAVLAGGLIETAPVVLFAHDYAATCISGAKRFAFPRIRSCSRRLGAGCLLNYLPRRCGGLSPITMWQEYRNRFILLDLTHHFQFILVASEAMRREYLRHAVEPDRMEVVPYPVLAIAEEPGGDTTADMTRLSRLQSTRFGPVHLLFAGRMVQLKGGEVLIRALREIVQILERPLKLTFAGDGPAKPEWEAQAQRVCAQNRFVSVEFTGWLGHANLQKVISQCDLLVVPSLWPEPFGMIGLEAGTAGLPTVAFALGGIPEWLHDGVNGFLASADPPYVPALAAAIAKCLADPALYQRLCTGARQQAAQFGMKRHVQKLQQIFARAIDGTIVRCGPGIGKQQARESGN
jgi:glycosyltransferase involved in cell wall biosynthesis